LDLRLFKVFSRSRRIAATPPEQIWKSRNPSTDGRELRYALGREMGHFARQGTDQKESAFCIST
jgi:hypothetical protein